MHVVLNCLHMFKIGVLDSITFLCEMGLITEHEAEIVKVKHTLPTASSTNIPPALKELYEGASLSFNELQNVNISRYARDFVEGKLLGTETHTAAYFFTVSHYYIQ